MNRYFKGLLSLPTLLTKKRKIVTPSGVCCISISPTEIALVYVHKENGKIKLSGCDKVSYQEENDQAAILATLVKKHQLANMYTTWLLQPEDYQLLLEDLLPIPPAEFQSAIRWKIKDLINFPIEEAIIDSFALPLHKTANPHKSLMVIVARANHLIAIANKIKAAELDLNVIDIPELALRNINACYENDEKSTALIYLQEKNSQLIITRQKMLYLSRRLDFGVSLLDAIPQVIHEEVNVLPHLEIDNFFLELQRSFDFYQSQWHNPIPTRILFTTLKELPPNTIAYLARHSTMSIQQLDIHDLLISQPEFSKVGEYLPLIGGVLRTEIEQYATAN